MAEQKQKDPKRKFLTIVLQYNEPTRKTDTPVTDLLYYIVSSIQSYNNNRDYESSPCFDLYGICVDDEEIAEQKNEFIKQIND